MSAIVHRILLLVALHSHLTAVVTFQRGCPSVRLFNNYDEAVWFAWYPITAGAMIFDGSRDTEWIESFLRDDLPKLESGAKK